MSESSLFLSSIRFRGNWAVGTVYYPNDVVAGSDGSAYSCLKPATTGSSHNPVTDDVNWKKVVPGAEASTLSATTVIGVSTTTFGINAGSTFTWMGGEWSLSNVGAAITLTKMKSNCNCNCNCNCTVINCNCAGNCACPPAYCNQSQCTPGCLYGGTNYCTCVCAACNMYTDCNCATNCNCNCTPI